MEESKISAEAQKLLDEHNKQRAILEENNDKLRFSYNINLTEEEIEAEKYLIKVRDEIADNEVLNRTIHNFFENKEFMENSKLHSILNSMPKGAIHHIHTTAANPIDSYLKLTYDPRVYYSKRENLFKVFPKHEGVVEGYLSCVKLREFSSDMKKFDEELKDEILLGEKQVTNNESHAIWKHFQHKFTKVGELGKFVPFFKDLLMSALQSCIDQKTYIVEYRHISGMLFDDDKKSLPFLEELKIIRECVDNLQKVNSHQPFYFKLILTGLKIVGKTHIEKMLKHIQEGVNAEDKKLAELIAGFDMVNEEDFTPEISTFAEDILISREMIQIECEKMPTFFHAGETHDRKVENIQDAIMLGSKRIGHGFQLALFPELQKVVKEKDICIEVCPLSNMVLGYTLDLRTHPVSHMLARGIQASISSDDPGFFGYEGVTLDWVYAVGAWQLDMKDIKQLSLNGITYSTVSQEQKDIVKEAFDRDWELWVKSVIEESKMESAGPVEKKQA